MTQSPVHAALRANTLGVGAITFFVVSAAGPLVAMAAGVPVAMLLGNGAGIPALFIVATLLLLAFAAGFTAMSDQVRSAGGFYAYAARGLGGHAAAATGAIAMFSYTAIELGVAGLFGSAAAQLVQGIAGVYLPWWAYALTGLGVISFLGYRQVDLSARVLAVLVLAEYGVVLALDLAIVLGPGAALTATPFSPEVIGSGSPAIGLLMCFAAFIGFEATTIYAEEARDPARTIPLATYFSLLLIGGFYVFSSWCMVAAVGSARLLPMLASLADPTTFVFHLAASRLGPAFATTMRLLLVTSSFAAMLAFHNAAARYGFALSRERLMPEVLSRIHRVHGSPYWASVAQSGVAVVVLLLFVAAGSDPIAVLFARVCAIGTLGAVSIMAVASAAVYRYFRWGPGRSGPGHSRPGNWCRTRLLPFIGTTGLISVLALGCIRFDALAGPVSPLVGWLPMLLLVIALLGVAAAERLRRADERGFRELGRVSL